MTRTRTGPRFRTHTLAPVLAYVGERGGDAAAVLRASGLPAATATAPWLDLPLDRLAAFYQRAADAAGRDPARGRRRGVAGVRVLIGAPARRATRTAPCARRGVDGRSHHTGSRAVTNPGRCHGFPWCVTRGTRAHSCYLRRP